MLQSCFQDIKLLLFVHRVYRNELIVDNSNLCMDAHLENLVFLMTFSFFFFSSTNIVPKMSKVKTFGY